MEYLSKRHPITIQLWKTLFRHLPSSWISTLAPFCIRNSTTSLRPKPNNVERKTICDGLGGTYQTKSCSIPWEYSNIDPPLSSGLSRGISWLICTYSTNSEGNLPASHTTLQQHTCLSSEVSATHADNAATWKVPIYYSWSPIQVANELVARDFH